MQAIILTVKEQGEHNRSVCVLSDAYGLFYATLYGGPKSKLRSLVQPFNSGTLYLYDDESRQSRKICDFDVTDCHTSLHANLYKIWAANLAAELMLKTRCAGDEHYCYILLKALVDGMEASDENGARLGMLRFLWRYLGLLGIQPDVHSCVSCGNSLIEAQDVQQKEAVYVPAESGFICADCMGSITPADAKQLCFALSAESLQYLAAINEQQPKAVRAIQVRAQAAWQIKQLVYYLAQQAAGCSLKSLESGMGIL